MKFLRKLAVVALLLGVAMGTAEARKTRVNGTVILPGNNLYGVITDSDSGKGIEGVPVTDGYKFTVTDRHGVYQMTASPKCRNVYYSLPSGYKVSLDGKSGLPLFYSTSTIDVNGTNRNDFTLEKLAGEEKNFAYVAVGDPQCKTESDVNRFRTETIPDMKEYLAGWQRKVGNVYVMNMGDIVFDTPEMWDEMKDVMSGFTVDGTTVPVFNIVGNHDHDGHQSDDYSALKNYVDRLGPVDYSFDRGDVHFVVMDNVVVTKTNGKSWREYHGGITDEQFEWLKQDLALVKDKENKMIVFCTHIPVREASARFIEHHDDLLQLLTDFHEAHIMVGHTHYPQNWIHENFVTKGGTPVYEHVHGAACGAWWCCNMNTNGAPNGYSVYEIEGNTMKDWIAKGTGFPEDFQMRVFNGSQVYGGEDGHPQGQYRFTWTDGGLGGTRQIQVDGCKALEGAFVAAVWNVDKDNWKIELYVDGVKAGDLQPVPEKVPNVCASAFFYNERNKNTNTWCSKAAQHYFYIPAPGGDPAKVKNWEIRATQTIPGSGHVNVYTCSALQTDYTGF